jgi:hypothetical protein
MLRAVSGNLTHPVGGGTMQHVNLGGGARLTLIIN